MIVSKARIAALFSATLFAAQLNAAPILHNSKTSFDTALGASLLSENFDDDINQTGSPLTIANSHLFEVTSNANQIFNLGGGADKTIGIQTGGGTWTTTFRFSHDITAFGFEMHDIFEVTPGTLTFSTSDGINALEVGTLINNQVLGDGNTVYLGLTNAIAFSEISLTVTGIASGDGGEFDDIGYALDSTTVPVPGSALLMMLGALGFRRFKGRSSTH